MEHLFELLKQYAEGDIYPYHMPGHKRQAWGMLPRQLYEMDITEIEGFDNLHQPEGILSEMQQRAARIYGADESFYLINGSTCGILCALSSALPPGGHILMARNCHKSAYHGAYLRNLAVSYLWPAYLKEYDIYDTVTPEQIRGALEREPDIGAVLIVSPTYEGRIADVEAIAGAVHEKGIPLIVDEAHGAHLGLAEGFSRNSCQAGADLVIHSVHKTLPSLTQTALLHVNGERIDRRLLKRFLHIYQSSSPSYLLMASIDNALQYVEAWGQEAFKKFRRLYGEMMERLAGCRHLRFLRDVQTEYGGWTECMQGRQDIGKLLISVKLTNLTGRQLYEILLDKYHLQTEMAAESYVLAMFTVNDGEEAYRRMTEALLEIDESLTVLPTEDKPEKKAVNLEGRGDAVPLAAAWDMPAEEILLEESIGRYAGEFISLYPPGIPLLVPGERMTKELCGRIQEAWEQGLTVQGIRIQEKDGCCAEKDNLYTKVLRGKEEICKNAAGRDIIYVKVLNISYRLHQEENVDVFSKDHR